MSLINDALKRAQKQRTGDSPPLSSVPGVGGETAAKIAKRNKPAAFNSQLTRLALGAAGILLVVVLGGYFVVRAVQRTPEAPPAKTVTATAPRPAEPVEGAKTDTTKPAVTFSLPVTLPTAPKPAPAQAPSITTLAGSEPRPSAPAASTPANTSEPAKPVGPPVKLDAKAIAFIENLRIAGIRASATDSKVLMNDRVYRTGDIVEHELGLKLTGITANSLSFEDERGGRYTRNF